MHLEVCAFKCCTETYAHQDVEVASKLLVFSFTDSLLHRALHTFSSVAYILFIKAVVQEIHKFGVLQNLELDLMGAGPSRPECLACNEGQVTSGQLALLAVPGVPSSGSGIPPCIKTVRSNRIHFDPSTNPTSAQIIHLTDKFK